MVEGKLVANLNRRDEQGKVQKNVEGRKEKRDD